MDQPLYSTRVHAVICPENVENIFKIA